MADNHKHCPECGVILEETNIGRINIWGCEACRILLANVWSFGKDGRPITLNKRMDLAEDESDK